MKRQHSHLRTVSSLPNLAYVDDLGHAEKSGGTARVLILGVCCLFICLMDNRDENGFFCCLIKC